MNLIAFILLYIQHDTCTQTHFPVGVGGDYVSEHATYI